MNISEMTAQEKSIKLLHLLDVWVECTNKQNAIWSVMLGDDAIATDVCPRVRRSEFDHWQHVLKTVSPNLYDEKNMALAWRVLNWAMNGDNGLDTHVGGFEDGYKMSRFVEASNFEYMPPSDAQTAWLDTILELAIEAAVIE